MPMTMETDSTGNNYYYSNTRRPSLPPEPEGSSIPCIALGCVGLGTAVLCIAAVVEGNPQKPVIDPSKPMIIPDNARRINTDINRLKYVIWNEDIKQFRCGGDIHTDGRLNDADYETTKYRHPYPKDTLSRSVVVCYNESGFINQIPTETFPSQHTPQLTGVNP